jgi:hypothetical protein
MYFVPPSAENGSIVIVCGCVYLCCSFIHGGIRTPYALNTPAIASRGFLQRESFAEFYTMATSTSSGSSRFTLIYIAKRTIISSWRHAPRTYLLLKENSLLEGEYLGGIG